MYLVINVFLVYGELLLINVQTKSNRSSYLLLLFRNEILQIHFFN